MKKNIKNLGFSNLIPYVIFLTTFILYSPSLNYNFVWDDQSFILKNEAVHNWKNIPRYFTDDSTFAYVHDEEPKVASAIRPIRNLLYLGQYYLFYFMPRGWHFINILLHAFNCVLLYKVIQKIISIILPVKNLNYQSNGLHWGIILITLWWGVHPVNTEVVAWVKSQDDLLSVTFFFLYLKTLLSSDNRSKVSNLILSSTFLLLALLTKESMVSAPIMAGCLLFSIHCYRPDLRYFKTNFLLICLHVFITLIYLIYRDSILGQTAQTRYLAGNFNHTMATMGTVWTRYFQLIFWPYPPTVLNSDYQEYPIKQSWADVEVIVGYSMLIIIPLIISWIALKKRQFLVISGLGMFIVGMIPVSNIIPMMQFLAERFLYFPLIGLTITFIPLAFKLSLLPQDKKRPAILLGLLIITFSGTTTLLRMPVWKSDFDLMESTVAVNTHLPHRPTYNYALRLYDEGETTESYRLLNELYKTKIMGVHDLLSFAQVSSKFHQNHNEAKFYLKDSLKVFRSPQLTEKLAEYELKDKNTTEAIRLLHEVLKLSDKPSSYQHSNLAKAYHINGNFTEALEQINIALALDKENLSAIYLKKEILEAFFNKASK